MEDRDRTAAAEPQTAAGVPVELKRIVSGDSVHFTKMEKRGTSIKFRTVYGKVVSIAPGDVATVRLRNGRDCWVDLYMLRKEGQRHHLTDAFVGGRYRELTGGGAVRCSARWAASSCQKQRKKKC